MAIAGGNINIDSTEGMDKITQTDKVTSPYFSNGSTTLNAASIVTSSQTGQATNEIYFFGIANSTTPTVQEFNVAFGDVNGHGADVATDTKSETEAIYKQYAGLLLAPTEVTGGFLPSAEGGFEYIEGSAIKAWAGHRLVIDEIDKAGGDVFATLLNMTDSDGSATWEHPITGAVHKPQAGFKVIMTTNVEHVEELPMALVDRFPVRIRIDRPHPDALETLPVHWREYASRMADAGTERMSLRLFQSLHQLSRSMGEEKASKIVLGPRSDAFLDAIKIDSFGER